MPRRLPQTLADYLVVAIAPALIGLMVGALMFFLVELLYPAEWHGRLRWVFGWYVVGIVGISRISLEEGWAYASLFAAALSGAVALVVPPASWPLLAVVWWAAHQLTRDTTLLDETQDASGEGLWETAVAPETSPAGADDGRPTASKLLPPAAGEEAKVEPFSPSTSPVPSRASWWWRLVAGDEPQRAHAPGRWVIYFCLAAVPLFGVGGWLLPEGQRSWAFVLLVVYTACGLGLLLATSFLGLRRYLRQRQVVMPPEMTAAWLAAGGILIAAMLLLALLLPRPTPAYSLTRLPELAAHHLRRASRLGWGREGLHDPTTPEAATTPGESDVLSEGRETRPADNPPARPSSRPAAQPAAGGASSGSAHAGPGPSQEAAQNASSPGQGSEQGREDQSGGQSDSNASSHTSESSSRQPAQPPGSSARSPRSNDGPAAHGRGAKAAPSNTPGKSPERSPGFSPQRLVEAPLAAARALAQGLAWLLRWLLTLGGVVLMVVVLWAYREELLAAWRRLLEELARLFSRRDIQGTAPTSSPPVRTPPPLPFSAYADPFATGAAARMAWPQLVGYTFEALQAWAREQGCPRREDQTPQEFVTQLRIRQMLPAEPLAQLVTSYNELAYASGRTTSRPTADLMRQLWHALAQHAPRGTR